MNEKEEFQLNYNEAILIRRALECFQYSDSAGIDEKKEAERLGWKIKDAFC